MAIEQKGPGGVSNSYGVRSTVARENYTTDTQYQDVYGGDGVAVTAKTNPLTGGSKFFVGDKAHDGVLMPSGGDDAARITEYVSDMAASGLRARLGPGDFVVGAPMVWRSRQVMGKWGAKGIGLKVIGAGGGNTRLLWASASNTDAMLRIDSPASAGIGSRNYLTEVEGVSFSRAPGGAEIAAGTTSGVGIMGVPEAAGQVLHTCRFRDLVIDGFDYGMTLSDCTLAELDTVWFVEFLVGLRVGYNIDICKIRHSMFGSEQFGTSYRNSAVAIQNGFSDGFNPATSENIIEIEHTWFMKHGKAFEANSTSLAGVRFNRVYLEDMRQYFHHVGTSNGDSVVSFSECHFSHPTTNDTAQSDPLLADYRAKIQFDGDPAVTGGKRPILTVRDCTADALQPANAWVSFNARNGIVKIENTTWRPSALYGHVRCTRTSHAGWRDVPPDGSGILGTWTLGDSNQGGLGVIDGNHIETSATIPSGGTYEIDVLNGTIQYLTLPDGNCTINVLAYAGVAPNRMISTQTAVKVILVVPASVGATRTITWGSRMKTGVSTTQYGAGDANKRLVLMLEGYSNSGSALQAVGGVPAFV